MCVCVCVYVCVVCVCVCGVRVCLVCVCVCVCVFNVAAFLSVCLLFWSFGLYLCLSFLFHCLSQSMHGLFGLVAVCRSSGPSDPSISSSASPVVLVFQYLSRTARRVFSWAY